MAFKMNGSPAKMGTISGTAGHSSALKMKAEQNAASALKQPLSPDYLKKNPEVKSEYRSTKKTTKKSSGNMANADWKKGQTKAKSEGNNLDALVKSRKGLKKGTPEYNKVQNKINSALGNSKRYDEGSAKPTKTEKVVNKAANKVTKIKARSEKKVAEVGENVTKKTTKISRKDAKKEFGKGSKEHLTAKKAHLEAKEADRQGSKGGRKQNIFRKLSSKINARKQKKNQEKLDAKNAAPTKKALKGNQKNLPEHLKAKIDAAPGKMYGKSMAKKYDK